MLVAHYTVPWRRSENMILVPGLKVTAAGGLYEARVVTKQGFCDLRKTKLDEIKFKLCEISRN